MDNLLFYSLLILIAYYFLVYTKPTRPDPQPTFKHSTTQTDPLPEPEPQDQTLLENTLDQLIKGINDLNKELE